MATFMDEGFECVDLSGRGYPVAGDYYYQNAVERAADYESPYGVLRPDPENEHDPNAVGVYCRNRQIGHLPREAAARLSKKLRDLQVSGYRVTGGLSFEENGDVLRATIHIDPLRIEKFHSLKCGWGGIFYQQDQKNPGSVKPRRVGCCTGALIILLTPWVVLQCSTPSSSAVGPQSKPVQSEPQTHVPAPTPTPSPAVVYKPLIGSTRSEIEARFASARREYGYERNVDPQAIKFNTGPALVIVYFSNANLTEGVSFLSNSPYMGDAMTGYGSYVHRNYQALVQMATGGIQYPVKPNSSTQHPVEIHIGNFHQ